MAALQIRRILGFSLLCGLCAACLAPPAPAKGTSRGLRNLDVDLIHYRAALGGSSDEPFAALAADFETVARQSGPTVATWARLVEADCLDRAGQKDAAVALWRTLEGSDSQIATYCAYRIGGADARAGARRAVGPFAPDLLVAAGEAETDPALAQADFQRALDLAPGGQMAEQALFDLATRATGDRSGQALRYLEAFPDGPHALQIAPLLDVAALSMPRREDLAAKMLDTGDYGVAVQLLAGDPSPIALYRLGRAYWRLGDHDKAIAFLHQARVLDPSLMTRVQLTLGQMAMAQRKWRLAIAPLDKAAAAHGKVGLDALDALVHDYLELNDDAAAARIDQQILAAYPHSGDANDARWRAMWKAMEADQRGAARHWAESLERDRGELGIAADYWLGRMDQDEGDVRGALRHYAHVSRVAGHLPPAWYYAWRARMRTNALTGRGADPGFAMVDGPVVPRTYLLAGLLPHAQRTELGSRRASRFRDAATWPRDIRVLAYLGLMPADRLPPGRTRMLVSAADGDYAHAISWAEKADSAGAAFSRLAENPLGFWGALEPAARSQGLDPLFLAALVKQESFFDPKSVSWAGAIGLAQLMPLTASWVGRKLGGSGSLYDPSWNLRCGAWYLAYTGRLFDHQGIFEAAAYNAGVDAVRRWRAKFGSVYASDPEKFIEEIPFFETRHYVKKVYGYYWTYCSLYRHRL